MLKEAGFAADDDLARQIAPLIQERVRLLSEVPGMVRFLFEDPAPPSAQELIPKKTEPARALDSLKKADALLGQLSDFGEEAEKRFRALAEESGMKLGDFLMPGSNRGDRRKSLPAAPREHQGAGSGAGARPNGESDLRARRVFRKELNDGGKR